MDQSKSFLQVVMGLPVDGPFDYIAKADMSGRLEPGMRVLVPFRKSTAVAYVTRELKSSEFEVLKTAIRILDDRPVLSSALMELMRRVADRYGCSWGEAIELAVPKNFSTRKAVVWKDEPRSREGAVNQDVLILHDPGFVKRTEIYRRSIEKTLSIGRDVIILVPEMVSLKRTEQWLKSFIDDQQLCCYDKSTAVAERERWCRIRSGAARVVLGVRSAIFAPVRKLGLIIVDNEEHDGFQEEQKPFVHVRDVALMRAEIESCTVLLASAAPSVELMHLAKTGGARWMALKSDGLSRVNLMDRTNYSPDKPMMLSPPVLHTIDEALKSHRSVMVYFPLTGEAIERVAGGFARLFPQAKIVRLDKETSRCPRQFDILIATHAVFKWLGEFSVDVGLILNIDTELNRMDVRSSHRAFALIAYLRRMTRDVLFVQTEQSGNECLCAVSKADHERFYKRELELRKELNLPPYGDMIAVVARCDDEDIAHGHIHDIARRLSDELPEGWTMTDAQEDSRPVLRGKFRYAVMVQGASAEKMHRYIKERLKGMRKPKGLVVTCQLNP